MLNSQIGSNSVADISVVEQVKKIRLNITGQVPVALCKLQSHAAHAAPSAVFEHDN